MFNIAVSLIVIGLINLVIGGVIFARRQAGHSNRFFLLLSVGIGCWSAGVGAYMLAGDRVQAEFYSNFYYAAALLIACSLYLFAYSLRRDVTWWHYLHLIVPIIYIGLTLPGAHPLIDISSNDLFRISVKQPNYLLYSLMFTVYFGWAIIHMVIAAAAARQRRRKQLVMVAAGVILAGIFGVVFNLWLPAIGRYDLIWVGPLFSLVFLLTTAYAVVRYKLFDLRIALARSLAYILSLSFVVIVYAIILMVVGQSFFSEEQTNQLQNLTYIGLAVLMTFTFQPTKAFFDLVSNNLFFNRSYEPERVIQDFGDAMLGSIRLDNLGAATLMVLSDTFAPQHMALLVDDADTDRHYIKSYGADRPLSKPEVRQVAQALGAKRYGRVGLFDVEELDDQDDADLIDLFDKLGIALVIRIHTKQQTVGFLVMGYRQNGAGYGSTDMYVLRTIGDELALAVENSLQFDQINSFNQTLQNRINEATSELRRSNRQLHKLDKTKDEFISMASHQLRTPLTTIKGYISMVLDGDVGEVSPAQRKLLEEAFTSSQRMVYLINDFLNVSRLQTGKFELEKRPVDLGEVLCQEIDQLKMVATSRQLEIDHKPANNLPVVEVDENKIRQVMMNFVDNAIYYSPSGSRIKVSLKHEAGALVFQVVDRGIGIPEDEQSELFTKFYRASNARKQRPDGTGVGLYMAKKVVIGHGGSIIFSSHEGKGSTFGFRLPVKKQIG